jgi:chemosensory pili system protein ChpE
VTMVFFSALWFGLVFTATPGAVNTESLRRGLARGFWPALLVQLGSLIGDTLWAGVALTGLTLVGRHIIVQLALGIMGTGFLLRLAWQVWWHSAVGTPDGTVSAARGDFVTGVFFSLANPFALTFWLGVGGGFTLISTGDAGSPSVRFALFLAGFVLGALVWCLGAASAILYGRRRITPAILRWINRFCGLTLGGFGVRLGWRTLRLLFM